MVGAFIDNNLSFSPLLCSLLFWINKGPGDKITLERSGMDGLKQESLVVLTAQAPRSLTLDVTVRRLYWMSDFKKVHDSPATTNSTACLPAAIKILPR